MSYASLPTFKELAAMWPLWLMLALGLSIWTYAWLQEEREWREWQHRLRRREMADRIKARQNQRN